jgi:hypothetical protein
LLNPPPPVALDPLGAGLAAALEESGVLATGAAPLLQQVFGGGCYGGGGYGSGGNGGNSSSSANVNATTTTSLALATSAATTGESFA